MFAAAIEGLKSSLQLALDTDPIQWDRLSVIMDFYINSIYPNYQTRNRRCRRVIDELNALSNDPAVFSSAASGQDMSATLLWAVDGDSDDHFFHNAFTMNSRPGSVIYFSEIDQGLISLKNPKPKKGVTHRIIWPNNLGVDSSAQLNHPLDPG